MRRALYLLAGWTAVAIGAIGIVLPLLPTVPLWILAAFFFSRSSPRLELWLVEHPRLGPHIHGWRERRAISSNGQRAAMAALIISSLLGLLTLSFPWSLLPAACCAGAAAFILSRPS
jgi:uncharacterized membrane protein YbaN (DUF454 family)